MSARPPPDLPNVKFIQRYTTTTTIRSIKTFNEGRKEERKEGKKEGGKVTHIVRR